MFSVQFQEVKCFNAAVLLIYTFIAVQGCSSDGNIFQLKSLINVNNIPKKKLDSNFYDVQNILVTWSLQRKFVNCILMVRPIFQSLAKR